mgnify:CR=1 FL=1|tara:strand:+ start:526 stop:1959 length:1434 start_codon:yes stop_codon:yes gene_type:complete
MRLQLAPDRKTATFADENGDGIDDDTGLPVIVEDIVDVDPDVEVDDVPIGDDNDIGSSDDDDDYETRWLLVQEGVPTGDGRMIEQDALTWRDLPLPLMATDETSHGHDGAKFVANLVRIEREDDKIYGYTTMLKSSDKKVKQLQKLIEDGDLKGVSVDMDMVEGHIVVQAADKMVPDDNGELIIPLETEKMVITSARIMGATAVPFPAFQEAQQLAASLVAGAATIDTQQTQKVALAAPAVPPKAWFDSPALAAPTPITVLSTGRLFGHIALWKSCHRGFADRCVPPPRNKTGNYAHFLTGEIRCDDGTVARVGHITVDGGHANESASAQAAKQHYDDTGWTAADVTIGEDAFGIWVAGSIMPGLDDLRIRKLMSHDVSGDWRRLNGSLELISIRTVPVPGFVKTVYASGEMMAMIAAVPVCASDLDPAVQRVADRIAASIGRTHEQVQAERDVVAFGIGRHPSQRRAALAAAVRGK